jgi:hypothetical protein
MNKNITKGIVLGLIFLSGKLFSQTTEVIPEKAPEAKSPQTSFHLILNAVGSNFNYGKSNRAMADYRKSVSGAQVGASFQAGITPRLSVVSEVYFVMKGGKLKSNNPLTTEEQTTRLYTIESPILARIHFGKFHVNAGPSIAYNVAGKIKRDDSAEKLFFSNSNGGFKRLDAGVQVGVGYTFRIKQKQFVVDVRYSYGLTNISHDKEMYNRYLTLSLYGLKPWKRNPLARN